MSEHLRTHTIREIQGAIKTYRDIYLWEPELDDFEDSLGIMFAPYPREASLWEAASLIWLAIAYIDHHEADAGALVAEVARYYGQCAEGKGKAATKGLDANVLRALTRHAEYKDPIAELQRCLRECKAALAYDGPDKAGACQGALDWLVEAGLIQEGK